MNDPRRLRSLHSIQSAFFALVLNKRYHEITIDQIIADASVARSTFYEHFKSKDALLFASLDGPFAILGQCLSETPDIARITALLTHFWQNRGLARTIFAGDVRRKLALVLAKKLTEQYQRMATPLSIPRSIASQAIAELLLGIIAQWLQAPEGCSAEQLASALHRSGRLFTAK
jgi:AcrR family transcriptional regulator